MRAVAIPLAGEPVQGLVPALLPALLAAAITLLYLVAREIMILAAGLAVLAARVMHHHHRRTVLRHRHLLWLIRNHS